MNLRPFYVLVAVVFVVMLGVTAWAWPQVPDGAQVPIHWGIDGQADGFAPKAVGLLALPGAVLLLAFLFGVIPRVEPRRENLARSGTAYRAVASGAVAIMAIIHIGAVAAATGRSVDIAALAATGVGLLLVIVGNYLGKVRSNFLVGIRTPWTLTSERSWARTHRLGGRVLVLLGLAVVAATALGVRGVALFSTIGAGTALLVVVLFAYSYLVWRDDPERRPLRDPR